MTERTRGRVLAVLTASALAVGAAPVVAQWSAEVTVAETGGIRRTAFPVSARLEAPEGRLGYVSQLRLVAGADEVPSQGTALSHWSDGSIREVEVDFNVSIGPHEQRSFELLYGSDVTATVPSGRGLSVTEDERSIQAGAVRLNKGGSTLLASVSYREEIIDRGRNGLAIVERSGIRRDPREIRWEPVEIVKSGPLRLLARYRGALTLSGSEAQITLDAEMPNSKSWLSLSVSVSDPDAKIGDLGFETPFRLGDPPWTWDFATPNGTYGALRGPASSAVFTRSVDAGGTVDWDVRAGDAGSEQPYEVGQPVPSGGSSTWAHLVGADEAVALVATEETGVPGTITMWFTGTGQTTVTFRAAEPATEHGFTLVQHYVGTPVPIGAATSPASILAPLQVTVE
jgi:hypothetical protein